MRAYCGYRNVRSPTVRRHQFSALCGGRFGVCIGSEAEISKSKITTTLRLILNARRAPRKALNCYGIEFYRRICYRIRRWRRYPEIPG